MRLLPLLVLALGCRVSKEDAQPLPEDTGTTAGAVDADLDGSPADVDCDDGNAAVYPGAAEACDGVDQDCDGEADDGVTIEVYADADGDGLGAGDALTACTLDPGYADVDGDCDDADPTVFPGAQEVCDGKDSDCDGAIDEDGQTLWFADADGDGFGDPATGVQGCSADGRVADYTDCDDADATAYPGAIEVCDGKDSDCDGAVDEDGQTLWYTDADGDGYGDSASATLGCAADGRASAGGDCDEANAAVHPGAADLCDNGVDDDCDGATDEEGLLVWYADADGDGYGDATTGALACSGDVTTAGDCDDGDATANPDGVEVCDGADDDCNGLVDDGLTSTWYIDYDGDGWGADTVYTASNCTQPTGYVAETGDCDDTHATVSPDAAEVCNDADDDCDGDVDEPSATDATTWYVDADGDGYGDPVVSDVECDAPSGYVADATDCDDTDATAYPGAVERYDGVDDDCDGTVDDNTWIGTGADGALTVTGTTTLGDAWAVSTISGATVTLTSSPTALSAGDEVLVINLHGSDTAYSAAGTYEFAYVASVAGTAVTLETALGEVYGEVDNSDLTDQAVQMVRVPQYTDVTVASGGLLTTNAWDGATGGVLVFRATGTVTVESGGAIAVDELGYAAGETGTAYNYDSFQGESYAGEGGGNHPEYNETFGEWANNYGGGGAHITGGGGNYAGGATAGDSWTGGSATPPEAGDTYGAADLSTLFFGSGGGGVWHGSSDPGPGGDGAGILFIGASAIAVDGSAGLTAMGGTTTHWATGSWTYGAGGGAGGSVWLKADTVTLAADAIDAGGGYGESTHIRHGGDGGYGRVRVDCNAVNGATCGTAAATTALASASYPAPGYEGTP